MSLHPAFCEMLRRVQTSESPLLTLPVEDARAHFEFYAPLCDTEALIIAQVEEVEIRSRDGVNLNARLYYGKEPTWTSPQPVLLYFHSGGFVFGSIGTADKQCRALALEAQCAVLSVGYRLAPEFPFPTAVNDGADSLAWIYANAHAFGLDTNRIAVGGESAGATLAAVTAIHARDAGVRLGFQLLIYPAVSRRLNFSSHLAFGDGYYFTVEMIRRIKSLYLRDERDEDDWRFAPLDARRRPAQGFANLAPAYLVCAQYDPLLDEQCQYARKLMTAGNDVHICCYFGMIHGFFSMGRLVPEVAAAVRADVGASLLEAFDG